MPPSYFADEGYECWPFMHTLTLPMVPREEGHLADKVKVKAFSGDKEIGKAEMWRPGSAYGIGKCQ
jgi:hypothetical protein